MAVKKKGLGRGLDGLFPMYPGRGKASTEPENQDPDVEDSSANAKTSNTEDSNAESNNIKDSNIKTSNIQESSVAVTRKNDIITDNEETSNYNKISLSEKRDIPNLKIEKRENKGNENSGSINTGETETGQLDEKNSKRHVEKQNTVNTQSPRSQNEKKGQEEMLKTAASGGAVILRISEVEPNREQPRKTFDEEGLEELAESIRQHGIIQPLIVQKRNEYYEIIAGERRWRAARMAGLKEIPVVIRDYSDREILEVSLIENIQREDLNPVEEAKAYQRLLTEFNLKQEEIAQRVSRNRTTITNALRLLKLDLRVQQMLIEGSLSAGHARALLALEDPEAQYQLAIRIADEKISVRDTERAVKKILHPAATKEKTNISESLAAVYSDMEEKLKAVFGTKVTLNSKTDQKGRIEIEYYSSEELERIYELLRALHTDRI